MNKMNVTYYEPSIFEKFMPFVAGFLFILVTILAGYFAIKDKRPVVRVLSALIFVCLIIITIWVVSHIVDGFLHPVTTMPL